MRSVVALRVGPRHVPVFRRHDVADRDKVRVARGDVLPVIVAAHAAWNSPGVVHAGRDLVLVVVLQYQLQSPIGGRVVAGRIATARGNIDIRIRQWRPDVLSVSLVPVHVERLGRRPGARGISALFFNPLVGNRERQDAGLLSRPEPPSRSPSLQCRPWISPKIWAINVATGLLAPPYGTRSPGPGPAARSQDSSGTSHQR